MPVTHGGGKRKFNGKIFREWGFEFRKRDAKDTAKRLRKRGNLVRVIHMDQKVFSTSRGKDFTTRPIYAIFTRRKR